MRRFPSGSGPHAHAVSAGQMQVSSAGFCSFTAGKAVFRGAWTSGAAPLTGLGLHTQVRTQVVLCHAEQSFLVNDACFWKEKSEPSCIAGGNEKCGSCFGRRFGGSSELLHTGPPRELAGPLGGKCPREMEATFAQRLTRMCTPALLTTAKKWEQPKGPLREEGTDRTWSIHTKEYYSARKRSGAGTHTTTLMRLGNMRLSERSHPPQKKPHTLYGPTYRKCPE